MYFLGVDIGTGSVNAVLINEAGEIISTTQKHYSVSEPQPGHREQDADIVKQAAFNVIKEIIGRTDDTSKIRCICFSAAMHSLLAVDKNNQPVSPALLWADTRSIQEAQKVKQNGVASEIYLQCGTPIHPMLPFIKLLWWKKNNLKVFVQAHKFISIKEYIFYELTGKYVIDYSMASATGMFDIHKLIWNEKLLKAAEISDKQLSEPVPTSWHTHELKKNAKQELNLPENISLVIGSTDGCLANIGSYIIPDEDMAITIGTSAAVRLTSRQTLNDEQHSIFNYVLDNKYFISGGASNNGAVLLEWLNKDLYSSGSIPALLREAFTVAPGSEGLIILPYLLGERAPVWDASAKGIVYGLQSHHTQKHFTRATIEGIVMNLYGIAEKLIQHQPKLKRIVASGGFIQSSDWLQLIADIFNLPVHSNSNSDTSAFGAALWGGKSLGFFPDEKITVLAKNETILFPQQKNHEIYMSNYRVFKQLYQTSKNLSE
jgi:gluconokinase